MADAKKGGKGSKKLSRSARQAGHNKGIRLHKILVSRERHVKNAIKSCGLKFAQRLKEYYNTRPASTLGKRAGNHRGTIGV